MRGFRLARGERASRELGAADKGLTIATWALSLALGAGACGGDKAQEGVDQGNVHDGDESGSLDGGGASGSVAPAKLDAGASGGSKLDAAVKPSKSDAGSSGDASSVTPPSGNNNANPDAGGADSGVDGGTTADSGVAVSSLPKCTDGSKQACGSITTSEGKDLQLGPYGVIMDTNVGASNKNQVSALDDNTLCAGFASSFGQSQASNDMLLDLMGADLSLYTVYRPANWVDGETYPIVTWGNGTCAKPEGYGALLRYVASHGFFVVAANSRYAQNDNTQAHGLDFAFKANADSTSPYYKKLDTTKVAAMGHSQGGAATATVASDSRVKTVILFNGGSKPVKPYLTITGDRDIGNPTVASKKSEIASQTKAAYLFYHMVPGSGSMDGHLTLMLQPDRVVEPTVAWLKFLLSNDAASKDYFVGANCKLCGHDADYEFGQKGL